MDGAKTSESRPFFIVGCGRSGTTLLREMLNAHPNLGTPPECPFLIAYLKDAGLSPKKAAAWLANEPFIRDWKMNISAKDFAECENVTEVVDRLHKLYLQNTHGERWGQKTPKFVRHLPLLKERFPAAQVIHVIRDGRSVAASYMRATWGPTNAYSAARYWKWNVLCGLRFSRHFPDQCLTIRYESLVEDPEGTLRDVLAFLNEPFDERVLQYEKHTDAILPSVTVKQFDMLGKPVSRDRINAWKKTLTPQDIYDFESVAGNLLNKLGYELELDKPSRLSSWSRRSRRLNDGATKLKNHLQTFGKLPQHYLYELRRRLALFSKVPS